MVIPINIKLFTLVFNIDFLSPRSYRGGCFYSIPNLKKGKQLSIFLAWFTLLALAIRAF